ncbi:AraC family transcriptional regulator [Ensifer sp. ENS05]|nr:AraC family transcriptional regulator [Ensifer sp. ENS05]
MKESLSIKNRPDLKRKLMTGAQDDVSRWDAADVLSRLIEPLRLRGAYVSEWKLHEGWGARGRDEPRALVHLVLSGRAEIEFPSGRCELLAAGDLAIFPRGAAHSIGEPGSAKTIALHQLLPERPPGGKDIVVVGEGAEVGRMICAGLDYAPEMEYSLYRTLPDLLIVRGPEVSRQTGLRNVIAVLADELKTNATGSAAVRLRTFELIFVLALRYTLEHAQSPLSRALSFPGIGAALATMYDYPSQAWTLEKLAKLAGMSRTVFSRTFTELVGEPPARHLKLRRLDEARRLLQTTDTPLEKIAETVGYESTVGLHLAFKAEYGISPGSLRNKRSA